MMDFLKKGRKTSELPIFCLHLTVGKIMGNKYISEMIE